MPRLFPILQMCRVHSVRRRQKVHVCFELLASPEIFIFTREFPVSLTVCSRTSLSVQSVSALVVLVVFLLLSGRVLTRACCCNCRCCRIYAERHMHLVVCIVNRVQIGVYCPCSVFTHRKGRDAILVVRSRETHTLSTPRHTHSHTHTEALLFQPGGGFEMKSTSPLLLPLAPLRLPFSHSPPFNVNTLTFFVSPTSPPPAPTQPLPHPAGAPFLPHTLALLLSPPPPPPPSLLAASLSRRRPNAEAIAFLSLSLFCWILSNSSERERSCSSLWGRRRW